MVRKASQRGSGGGKDPQSAGGGLSRLGELGSIVDVAAVAADNSGLLRLRLVVRALTQLILLLQALIAAISKRRKAKAVTPSAIHDCAQRTGWPDALVSHTEVYDLKGGHTFDVWEIGRWGHDDSRIEVCGRGATLEDAEKDMRRGKGRTKPRW